MTTSDDASSTAVQFGDPRLPTRFWNKVATPPSGCWIWTGSKNDWGYGNLRFDGGVRYAHRVAREVLVGPIPDGLFILHACDTPSCVNPDHLKVGTQGKNLQECVERGRNYWASRTHCKRGHEFTAANTCQRSGGTRGCRECRRENDRTARHNASAKKTNEGGTR